MRDWLARWSRFRGTRWGRFTVRALLGLTALYFVYVAAVAVFLCAGGLEWATKREKDARVLSGSGYSLFPGYVHINDLRVRFQDYNIEMEIAADSANAWIALWELPLQQVHVYRVEAEGAEYRMVHRVHDGASQAERLRRFPHIEGFDRPKVYDAPPPPPAGGDQWTVRFDSIDAEVRLAWVLEYQLRGKLRARGSFRLDPLSAATIDPCSVEIEEGRLISGAVPILSELRGHIQARVDTFYPPKSPIDVIVPRLSAEVRRLEARVDSLEQLALYLDTSPFALQGKGRLRVDVVLDHGQLKPSSRAELALAEVTLQGRESRVSGTARLGLTSERAEKFTITLDAHLPAGPEQAVELEELTSRFGFEHRTLLDASARSVDARLRALAWKRPQLFREALGDAELLPLSGRANFEGHLRLPPEGRAELRAKLDVPRADFRLGTLRWSVAAQVNADCQGTRRDAGCELDAHLPYALIDRRPDPGSQALWLRAKSKEKLRVSVERGSLAGSLTCVGGDPKPALSEAIGSDWLAQLGLSLVPTGPIRGELHVDRKPQRFRLLAPDFSFGNTQLRGGLEAEPKLRGAWLLDMPALKIGLELKPDGLSVHPLAGQDWLVQQGFGGGA